MKKFGKKKKKKKKKQQKEKKKRIEEISTYLKNIKDKTEQK